MKFTVSQGALARAVSIVSKALASNNTMPILSCIYLNAHDGEVELQATDLTTYIQTKVAAHVDEAGEAVVSGKVLSNIVKVLPDKGVSISSSARGISLTCAKSSYNINVLNPADYQQYLLPSYELETSVELPRDLAAGMVDKVIKAVARDASRPVLRGIFLTVENNVVRMVSTDSHRIAVCDTNVETSALSEGFKLIVPGSAFHDILAASSDSESIRIGATRGQVVFVSGMTTYLCRGIEGDFVNHTSLLPSEYVATAQLDQAEFSGCLRRVAVMSLAGGTNLKPAAVSFELDVDGRLITISSGNNDQGEAHESMNADIEGKSASISFNHQYISDCVSVIDDKSPLIFEVGLMRGKQVGLIKSPGKINYLYLMMPINPR